MSTTKALRWAVALCAVSILVLPGRVVADDSYTLEWTGRADPWDGLWGNIYNWKDAGTGARPDAPPELTDSVYIYNGDTVLVTAANAACRSLTLGTDWDLLSDRKGSGALEILPNTALTASGGGVVIGQIGSGWINQTGGTLKAGSSLTIGKAGDIIDVDPDYGWLYQYASGGAHGRYTLADGEVSLNDNHGYIYVGGNKATGILEQTGGRIGTSQPPVQVGTADGWGIYSGAGNAKFEVQDTLQVVGELALADQASIVIHRSSAFDLVGGGIAVGYGGTLYDLGAPGYGVYRQVGGTCEISQSGLQIGSAATPVGQECYSWLTPGAAGARGYGTIRGTGKLDSIGHVNSDYPSVYAADLGVGGGNTGGGAAGFLYLGETGWTGVGHQSFREQQLRRDRNHHPQVQQYSRDHARVVPDVFRLYPAIV